MLGDTTELHGGGLSQAPTHVQARVLLRILQSLFWGEGCFSVLPSSLQSAIYSCPRRTSRFLESVSITGSITMLTYNTQQITKFLTFSQSGAVYLPRVFP